MKRERAARGKYVVLGFSLLLLGSVVASCSLAVDPDELSAGCPGGTKLCDGECVSTSDPEKGCGRPSCQPCALRRATAICAPSGECVVGTCTGRSENCNGTHSDGCEVDTDTDVRHCGGCNAPPCNIPNADPDCAAGECAILRCRTGFRDCDINLENGCEIDLMRDRNHCGACNTPCAEGQNCVSGSCG